MDWMTILINAGLPVVEAKEITVEGMMHVDATFSRELAPEEWQLFLTLTNSIQAKKNLAKTTVRAIPNWATWTQADWNTYFDANLSTTQVAGVTTIAQARAMMNKQNAVIQNLVKLVIALRDETMPDL